jgi:hypothetical protein
LILNDSLLSFGRGVEQLCKLHIIVRERERERERQRERERERDRERRVVFDIVFVPNF